MGLRDVRAQEKMGVSEKLGDGLSSVNVSFLSTRNVRRNVTRNVAWNEGKRSCL